MAGGGERQLLFGINLTEVLNIAVNRKLPDTGGIDSTPVKQTVGAQGHVTPRQQGATVISIGVADTERGELHIPPGFQFVLVNQGTGGTEHQITPRR
ncbi:Uncharacterised protein [Yersinia intermedia]|nr:Uncharacterised protein [Yersinia intermedia]